VIKNRLLGILLLALALLAGVSGLSGCSTSDPLTSGIVVEKDFDDVDDDRVTVPVYTNECKPVTKTVSRYDSVQKKTVTKNMTVTECKRVKTGTRVERRYDGEHWNIKIQEEGGDRTAWVEVDEETYNGLKIGDTWTRP